MGRIGRLIKSEIGKFIVQTVECYMGANVTAETFAAGGDDAPPLPDDRILLVKVDGTGSFAAAGVLSKSQGAKPGEKFIYSRDSSGKPMAAIRLKNDGRIEAEVLGDAAFELKDKAGNTVKSTGGGLEVSDKNGNSVKMTGSGMTLEDKNGGKVVMAGKITVQGKSGKVEVS